MDSSLVSAKPLRSANAGVAVALAARRKATVGVNARRPFLRSFKSCQTGRIENEKKGKGRL